MLKNDQIFSSREAVIRDNESRLYIFLNFNALNVKIGRCVCHFFSCLFLPLQRTMKFFKHRYGKPLCLSDKLEFLNLWYVTIIVNDILTIVGSGYKIQIESRVGERNQICEIYSRTLVA